ncbi:MAG: CDP-glycerol glycerophosphotransferase, partial [Thermoleophilaceae bacterium]|nr:CDP-glycerol glycerophosphotransferase [Thermoleophilaceae bacterium]
MPRISVVVPVYNVELYLETCLESIAGQTFGDLEVVMVDDGSTDGSAAIAERFVQRDPRFRLVTQTNGGLSKARNTGTDAATGEFLAFVDSDDYLAPNAYELLLGALDETGSDFATGNVQRLTKTGSRQVFFLADAFAKTQLKTHVSEFPELVADRVAWNKLFRRSFWDRQGRRFPEGVLNEDIPVILPAHFAAKSVDVIADPVYYWRIRGGEELSITQRRLEPRALLDRIAAIEKVTDHLEETGHKDWKRRYQQSVVGDDLRLYLNLLGAADDEYRKLFLDRVNALLESAGSGIFEELTAIDRLKWELVRRRHMPELLEVLRFQREEMKEKPPVRIRGRWYGDYPYLDDERLGLPRSVYRLKGELRQQAEIESLDWDGRQLRVRGHTFVHGIGAPTPETQRVRVVALRRGRLRRVRLWLSPIRWKTSAVERPDVTANSRQQLADLRWSGFEATLDPDSLKTAGRWRAGAWELYVTVRVGTLRRRRARFEMNRLRPLRGVDLPSAPGLVAKAAPTAAGGVALEVRDLWATVRGYRMADAEVLELSGHIRAPAGAKLSLEAVRRSDDTAFKFPLTVDHSASPATFTAPVKLRKLLRAGADVEEGELEDRNVWDLFVVGGGPRRSVGMPEDAGGEVWERDGRAFRLARTKKADASLVEQSPRPVIDHVAWTAIGELEVAGRMPPGIGPQELVLSAREYAERHVFPIDGGPERFTCTLTPARIESMAGTRPLKGGTWDLLVRPAGSVDDLEAPMLAMVLGPGLYDQIPLTAVVDHKPFTIALERDDRAALVVERDLDEDERGPYNQRVLRDRSYEALRSRPLRDAVVFTSFHGRQFSDSPRSIHEELLRREAPLEHLWVVRDGMAEVPATARVIRDASRQHYEALATARYVVTNDHFPDWFVRRPEQVCLQTWHGAPLKRLGFDVADRRNAMNRFTKWDQQVLNWQYV